MVHSEARTIFDDIAKNQPSNTWISWVNAQMLYFRLSREYVTVDLGTAISVSDRFCRIFLHAIGTACFFFAGIELQHVA